MGNIGWSSDEGDDVLSSGTERPSETTGVAGV